MKTILSLSLFSILVFQSTSLGQDQQKTAPSNELVEAATLNQTVVKLFSEKKYAEALPLARRALEIRERLLASNDERIELSLKTLGDIQLANREFKAAKETYNRLLQKQMQRVGSEDLVLAATFDRLAVVYFRERSDAEAEKATINALTLREAKLGPNHPDVAETTFGLAEQFRMRGRATDALRFYLRALSIHAEHSGVKTPEFEKARQGLTCSIYESGRNDLFKVLKDVENRYAPPTLEPAQRNQGVLNGRALSLPKPEYSPAARILGEAGVVVVKVMIDENGKVASAVDMCQAPPNIRAAAIYAASKARFTPTQISGKPTAVTGVITYRFIKGG